MRYTPSRVRDSSSSPKRFSKKMARDRSTTYNAGAMMSDIGIVGVIVVGGSFVLGTCMELSWAGYSDKMDRLIRNLWR